MKKSYFYLCLIVLLGISNYSIAQTNPGTANLKHQWTFDNGSATDAVGGIVGEIIGNGKLANNAFVATNAYMNFPAASIGINAYPELTVEIWCTSVAGANAGWSMLANFGETNGAGQGVNCTFVSIARGDNQSLATLEAPTFNGAWGPEYDDGLLHHVAYTINDTTITLYIDGAQTGTSRIAAGVSLAGVSTSIAYLGRGGWSADPNWIGSFHKFSIFNKSLSAEEILFLYQDGPEDNSVINVAKNNIALDASYYAEAFNVTGVNLTQPITITAPAGITVVPASLPANASGSEVYVVWDTTTPVDGHVVLTSGSSVVEIPIRTANDTQCYTPLYTDVQNIVTDPGLNSLTYYAGWGTREVQNIISNPENVYCGAASIAVGSGIGTGSGSLDFTLTGGIMPNTFYRVKAMIKTVDGSFQLGVFGWSAGQGDINNVIDTKGEWMPLDFTFTTGPTLAASQGMFFNNWACTGTRAFIDNWEMYEAPDPKLSVSRTALALDPEYKEVTFTVTGANLAEGITITTPAGITATPASLPATSLGEAVTLVWDGTTPVNGEVTASSTGQTATFIVKSTASSNTTCFVPLYTNKTNIVPDPFMNDMNNFGGWGAGRGFISIIDKPDSVYCGSHSGVVIGTGSMDVILTGKMKVNTSYIARAMVMTIGGAFQMGVWGMNAYSNAEVQDSLDTQGTWMPLSLEFSTADSLATGVQGMFINNWQRSGKRAFIDNWELYEVGGTSVENPLEGYNYVYVQGDKIVAEYELNGASEVEFAVYNLQGAILNRMTTTGQSGRNRQSLDGNFASGVYLVKITTEGKSIIRKVVR